MHIRPKTKRRLLILFAVAISVAGLLMAVWAASRHRNAVALRNLRSDAMTAYRAGDYEKSVELFQEYLDKATDPDPDVQYAFGISRIHVPMPGNKEIYKGIDAFRQYLDTMKPGDPAAERQLLQLYVQASDNVEAEHLADEMLARNPRDGEVMLWKVYALVGEHHLEDALKLCLKLDEEEPLNLGAQREALALMAATNAPADQTIAHAMALHQAHEHDPRFDVLLADAYWLAKQEDQRKKWLLSAAAQTPPDAKFVLAMVSSLDNAGLYSDAGEFLTRAADTIADPLVQRLMAQRLWQQGKLADLEARLKGQDPASRTSDGMLLGYRALALYADGKSSDAKAVLDGMSQKNDASSAAWAMALGAKFGQPAMSLSDRIGKYESAVARDPLNPVLRLLLAEDYLKSGEAELALRQCMQASDLAPSWEMPYVLAVDGMLASGRNAQAVANAGEAWKRAPEHYDTAVASARAQFALVAETGTAGDYATLIPLLQDIQKAWHDPQTLGIYVTALSRCGRDDEAVNVIKAALAANPPLPQAVLTNLAEIAADEHLNAGQDVLDAAEKAHGLTPEIAYTKARALVENGKQADALKLLQNASSGHQTELAWRVVIADFHEMVGDADSLKDWIALGDQYPSDLHLQQTILRAPSRMKDRAFWERTIDRVKALAGEQALLWRIERGRWLLCGDLSDRDKAEAVNLLTQVTTAAPGSAEAHRLLAMAMEKVNNIPGAIGELAAAADARPADPAITRSLVELLLADDRLHDAMAYLDKLAHRPRLPDDVREWLVHTYVQQGANDKALALLADDKAFAAEPVRRDLIHAELYRRVGNDAQASRLYLALLDKPISEPAYILEAADFFAARQDMATAKKFLEKLDALSLKPGEIQVDHAEFAERWIGVGEAFKDYQAAIAAAGKSSFVWEKLAAFHLRHERFADAAAIADAGIKAADSAALKAIRTAALALDKLKDGPDMQALIEALCQNPLDPAANEMLAAMTAAHTAKLSPEEAARQIRAVADRRPQNMPLQAQAVRAYLFASEPAAALELAQRAANLAPKSAEPQRLLTDIYVRMGAWSKAEQAALLWREHAMGHTQGADLALAEIYLRQPKRDPAGAVRLLSTHVSAAAPLQNPLATELYAKGLVMLDRVADASNLLKPLLADSPHWRRVWLDLATAHRDASAASDWITQVSPFVPADSQNERIELANAWYLVGTQFDSPAEIDNAGKIVEPMLAGAGDSTPQAWMLAAQIAHARGDYPTAEKDYRQVLKLEPHSVEAMNNLAYVLWLAGRNEDLPEARRLAEAATAGRPADASFFDTLARIQARADDRPAAIASFRLALQKDPTSVEAMIGLADLLARDPATRDQAKGLLSEIQRSLDNSPRLSSVLRKQYQTARDAVASSL